MKQFLFYIAFFICSISVFSQEEKTEVQYDDTVIEQKKFDTQKIEEYKEKDEFIYIVEKREPTILEKIWDWLKRTVIKILSYIFDDITPAVGFLRVVLKILPYVIAGLVLFFIIKFFLKVNAYNIIDGKKAKPIVHLSEEEELIKDKDLPKLIQKATSEGNYQLAVRYYYLLLLKKLSDKEFISWQQEKTNEDYIKELSSKKQLYTDFKELTYLYDYVWYGEFFIDKEKFIQAENNFKNTLAKIY
ncbi:DUF4129 domain-containing protein [Tenacibaculum singaporense]|uniref:DUF4129 domain-containing protein n=1 Tax=Tenacibaculum singaporense TaxID=2358479 RepID=UPI000F663CB8|nr:DUF4129 domain-containing protein [Tenacibaculum singaporense]RSC92212.1 DUF4129 domain-containing protein [Tenacibaculum singaporense]